MIDVARFLAAKGVAVTIITSRICRELIPEEFKEHGTEIYQVAHTHLQRRVDNIREMAALIEAQHIEALVFTRTFHHLPLLRRLCPQCRIVCVNHGMPFWEVQTISSGRRAKALGGSWKHRLKWQLIYRHEAWCKRRLMKKYVRVYRQTIHDVDAYVVLCDAYRRQIINTLNLPAKSVEASKVTAIAMGSNEVQTTNLLLNCDEEEARKAAEKISEGSFGLDDFLDQLQQVRKLGSMKSLLGMIPGMAQHRKELEQFDEREIDRTEAIIRSMTPAERRDPSIINGSRRARIAYGSGVTVSQVNALLQRFEQAAKMMKRMSNRGGMGGGIPGFGGPAMGGGKKKGKNKKKGGKSGNPMKREAEEKALRDKLAGKSSGSTGGSAFAKKPQNPALPAGLEQMMGNVDGGTELPPNLGGGLGGLFGR